MNGHKVAVAVQDMTGRISCKPAPYKHVRRSLNKPGESPDHQRDYGSHDDIDDILA